MFVMDCNSKMALSSYTMRIIPYLVNRQVYIVDCYQPLLMNPSLRKSNQVISVSLSPHQFFKNMYIFVNVSDGCCSSVILNPLGALGGIIYISVFIGD